MNTAVGVLVSFLTRALSLTGGLALVGVSWVLAYYPVEWLLIELAARESTGRTEATGIALCNMVLGFGAALYGRWTDPAAAGAGLLMALPAVVFMLADGALTLLGVALLPHDLGGAP